MDYQETKTMPLHKVGIAQVENMVTDLTISLVVTALNEGSHLVSNATRAHDPEVQKRQFEEAEKCVSVALDYLSKLLAPKDMSTGTRISWMAGYNQYTGTVIQTMDDGRYMVVPDGDALYIAPSECEVV